MSSVEIQSVLSQLRALQARAGGIDASQSGASAGAASAAGGGFGQLMTKALDQVNRTQAEAQSLAQKFELGDRNTSLAEVMLANARSQVSFNALSQVRNRVVRAYQEVMNMPI